MIKMKKSILFLLIILGFSSSYAQIAEEWVTRYNGPGSGTDEVFSIAVDNTSNVYVTGRSIGIETFDDYCTIKYNFAGEQQWVY